MAFQPQRMFDIKVAASPNIQTAFGTELADGFLTLRMKPKNSDVAKRTKIFRSDLEHIKGDEFASQLDELSKDLSRTLTLDANSNNIGWAAAMLLGNVVTIQPSAGPDPNAWEHTITFQPQSGGKDAQVTTIAEQFTADLDRKLVDMALSELTLSGGAGPDAGPLELTTEWLGSGVTAAAPASYPALVAELAPLLARDVVFSLGTEGAPTDISEQVLEWSLTINQGLLADSGYHLGSGKVRGRTWYGQRRVTFSFVVHMKETDNIETLFDSQLKQEIKIFIDTGVLTTAGTAENHDLEIRLPAIKFNGLDDAEEVGMKTWRIDISSEAIFKGGTLVEPVQFVVTNEEIDYLQTV